MAKLFELERLSLRKGRRDLRPEHGAGGHGLASRASGYMRNGRRDRRAEDVGVYRSNLILLASFYLLPFHSFFPGVAVGLAPAVASGYNVSGFDSFRRVT